MSQLDANVHSVLLGKLDLRYNGGVVEHPRLGKAPRGGDPHIGLHHNTVVGEHTRGSVENGVEQKETKMSVSHTHRIRKAM